MVDGSICTRRSFVRAMARLGALPLGISALAGCRAARDGRGEDGGPLFRTRGVVLVPDDLTLADWPRRAADVGLTTIALHHGCSPAVVAGYLHSERGARFLADCARLGLAVEYELHAMGELLPRELFAREPAFFRVDENGERSPDANLCVHSARALELVAENALRLDRELRPTTHRRFLWGDDGAPWCRCAACAELSDSEQALIVENRIVAALRRVDPQASLAHLAYANTLAAPRQVRPAEGVFLEFAPLDLRFRRPLTSFRDPANADVLEQLDANLAAFPVETAQALEYWLDDSMYSNWRKPAAELPWNEEAVAVDVDLYASRGVRHVTSFAVFLDADYVARFGFPAAVARYGALLSAPRAGTSTRAR